MNKKLLLAHIAMFTVALIYAANFTIAKPVMAGNYVQPFGFIMMRALAATSLLWLTHLIFVREKADRKDFWRFALCGAFGVAGNQLTFFYGLNMTTPINGALIMLMTPILVLLLSMVFFKEALTILKGSGIILGITGASLLILAKQEAVIQDAPNPMLGNIYVGINATCYAFYLVLVKPLMSKYSPLTTLKWVFLFGTIYIIPFGWSQMMEVDFPNLPPSIVAAIAFVLIAVTFLAYLLNGAALSVVKASVASTYIYLQPLLASIIAIGAGKDQLTGTMMLAGVLIASGVYAVSYRPKKQAMETIEVPKSDDVILDEHLSDGTN